MLLVEPIRQLIVQLSLKVTASGSLEETLAGADLLRPSRMILNSLQ